MAKNLVDWTSKQFENAKAQVINANLHQIELLASHCDSLDLNNPIHIQVQLVLMAKISELEEELEALHKFSYEKCIAQALETEGLA
ncbi:hypothetical protein CF394_00805 [Tetzosporium hominis]|uniref:Uncharacterized protein n=1 Tax=Tetzosporium hominis TaxID=2020506 RepID=A0A264W8Y1_9BACL|nr:hypothetical protein [Tetzosporium hominis]OZS79477.1 hypothetical protein CF394_00805 [Tetzosporium hominis]